MFVLPGAAPALVRHWKATPLPGVTTTSTKAALAAVPLRSITPALAPALVLVRLATRATMVPSPVSDSWAKLNWSDLPPTSAPPPLTVQVPALYVALPALAGLPTSLSLQPGGRPGPDDGARSST